MKIREMARRCEALLRDPDLHSVAEWKKAHPGGRAIGYFPVYVPAELIHAAGMLPVGVFGAGGAVEIDHADARIQSFVCSISRSTLELGLTGRLDLLDGMVFGSICDVARNLSGIWQRNFPGQVVEYVHYPQNPDSIHAAPYYRGELERLRASLGRLAGRPVEDEALRASLRWYDRQRDLLRRLHAARRAEPWRVSWREVYLLAHAGHVLPVEEHAALLEEALALIRSRDLPRRDRVRVVIEGSFCEQPPADLLDVIEEAGCYVVEDDLLLGLRWFDRPVEAGEDPLGAMARAFIDSGVTTSIRHDRRRKGEALLDRVKASGAEGVIFSAAKFCEPALLDYPLMRAALERRGIPSLAFEFEEKMGTFESLRTQVETFVESILFFGPEEEAGPAAARPAATDPNGAAPAERRP
jgi:benzoyl-CoA reductase subunit C